MVWCASKDISRNDSQNFQKYYSKRNIQAKTANPQGPLGRKFLVCWLLCWHGRRASQLGYSWKVCQKPRYPQTKFETTHVVLKLDTPTLEAGSFIGTEPFRALLRIKIMTRDAGILLGTERGGHEASAFFGIERKILQPNFDASGSGFKWSTWQGF